MGTFLFGSMGTFLFGSMGTFLFGPVLLAKPGQRETSPLTHLPKVFEKYMELRPVSCYYKYSVSRK